MPNGYCPYCECRLDVCRCTDDESAEMTMPVRRYKQLRDSVRNYANHQPLDLKSPSEIQKDLLAMTGDRHRHMKSIGSDSCLICGLDLRDPIHLRVGE